jgi:hypothetical protein
MANFDEKENRIKEQRTIEATKKGLMGAGGKLGIIVKNMGQPIIAQNGSDYFYLPDPYEDKEPNSEFDPVDGDNFSTTQIGWIWDGLRAGMHLEIKYTEESKELTVYYQGNRVYQETAGELVSYLPHDNWESLVNRVFTVARKKENHRKQIKKEERTTLGENLKKNWLQRMRDRWGI